ncbi:MAG: ribosomal protein S19 family protein [Candidatus Pacearchaeota archaeon]|nr:ribosomal protein S19 family protein [Candidatus Pacearchaeota archaeon]MDZ4226812.1 ribosomal protein S19 family protein [Candidatus Pacearchaeota archaeon]
MVVEEVKIRSKEKKYRGMSLEEMKILSVKDSAVYLPSRSRRSVLRHPEIIEKFVKSCENKISKKKRIRTHLRDIVIVPRLIGMTIGVHDGRAFQDVQIGTEMMGHRLGEFALTRKRVAHSGAGIGATKGSRMAKK